MTYLRLNISQKKGKKRSLIPQGKGHTRYGQSRNKKINPVGEKPIKRREHPMGLPGLGIKPFLELAINVFHGVNQQHAHTKNHDGNTPGNIPPEAKEPYPAISVNRPATTTNFDQILSRRIPVEISVIFSLAKSLQKRKTPHNKHDF